MSGTFTKARAVMSPLSIAGFVCSVAVYVASFSGLTLDRLGLWTIPIFLGMFIGFSSMIVAEHFQTRGSRFTTVFRSSVPKWAWFIQYAIMALALIHIVWSVSGATQGSPSIVDGQYVLDNRGVLTTITRAEYLRAGGHSLRSIAAVFMLFYYVNAIYWSFVKQPLYSTEIGLG